MSEEQLIHCSFCGRSESECKHLNYGKGRRTYLRQLRAGLRNYAD